MLATTSYTSVLVGQKDDSHMLQKKVTLKYHKRDSFGYCVNLHCKNNGFDYFDYYVKKGFIYVVQFVQKKEYWAKGNQNYQEQGKEAEVVSGAEEHFITAVCIGA